VPHGGANPYDPRHALLRHLHRLLSSRGYGQYRSLQPRPGIARVPWPSKDLSSRQPLHDPPPNAHPAMFKFYPWFAAFSWPPQEGAPVQWRGGFRPAGGTPCLEARFSDPHCIGFLEAFNARAHALQHVSEHLGHLVARAVDLRDAQWRFSRSTPSLRTGAQSPRKRPEMRNLPQPPPPLSVQRPRSKTGHQNLPAESRSAYRLTGALNCDQPSQRAGARRVPALRHLP
jgi:hypothetical protein